MNQTDLLARITPICREVFKQPNLDVIPSLDATQVDTWTSLSFMRLLSRIEDEFCFKFKITDLLKIRNIGSLLDVISTYV